MGLIAVGLHWALLGMLVPAMKGTFAVGWLVVQCAFATAVLFAMLIPLAGERTRFSLSPGLLTGVAQLHLPVLCNSTLQPKAILRDMAEAVVDLERNGVHKLQLFSVLIGGKDFRATVAARLRMELAQKGLAWDVVDEGTRKSVLYDLTYWGKFVAIPAVLALLGLGDKASMDLQRFRQDKTLRLSWGVLILEKR
jgi:hypothetical protein